ncbi:flavodoxin domain-containing protein [Gryllotalpicola kribbensis]|jgi:menaquinone-dependent protoporphyrinogen oxidase|uniref:Flavodoxin domain-containing protein n=1 Tax=Gryllotalpicola kribbensis TaxID=993084 RepID=A0ABP8AKD9_9MICO
MTSVLVAYASRRGGTTGIAEWIALALTSAGLQVGLEPASLAGGADLEEFDAAVIAGSVYEQRWHPDARRLVHRVARQWVDKPVWLVASGPLTTLTAAHPAAIAPGLRRAADEVHARGITTFGGRLDEHPSGWLAGAVAKKNAGDFRDRAAVERWAAKVAHELAA